MHSYNNSQSVYFITKQFFFIKIKAPTTKKKEIKHRSKCVDRQLLATILKLKIWGQSEPKDKSY